MIPTHLLAFLRNPNQFDDKYSRGVVGFITGSLDYPGAAILGVTAAMRSGIGMVRYLGPREVGELLLQVRPETVLVDGKAQCWVLGSGIVADSTNIEKLQNCYDAADIAVVDAGAIQLINFDGGKTKTVITPHAGELARILRIERSEVEAHPAQFALAAAESLKIYVLLKGNTSWIASPNGELIELPNLSPALSTAGTGDVLAGILGAILASNHDRALSGSFVEILELGVQLHSAAAEFAAEHGPVVALDVAESVRSVIASLN